LRRGYAGASAHNAKEISMKLLGIIGFGVILAIAAAGCADRYARDDDDRREMGGDDDDREQTVTMDQVPPAVRETLMRESTGGKIAEIDRVTESGRTMYEADVMLNGKKWEVAINENGTLKDKKRDRDDDPEDERTDKNEREDD
jgi:hypothetical protein